MFFLILIFSFGNFRISDGLSPSLLQLNFSTPLYAEALPTIRIANDIPSLDWHKTLDLISARVILNLMVGLTEFNKEGKLVPALAQKWSISPDGKTYVFTLKEGLKWSDRTPLTAQHFVDGILRLLNPKTAAQGADFFWILVSAKEFNLGREHDFNKVGIRALDKKTIEFRLVRPTEIGRAHV